MAPILSTFVWGLGRAFRSTGAKEGTTVTLHITGASGGDWTVVREEGEWKLYTGMPEQPDSKVTMNEDDAWRLFTRGIDLREERKRINIEGDPALGEKVLDTVSIIA